MPDLVAGGVRGGFCFVEDFCLDFLLFLQFFRNLAHHIQQRRVYVGEKTGGYLGEAFDPEAFAFRHPQLFPCPGHGYKAQPPFFLQRFFLPFLHASGRREDSLRHSHQKDPVKFQPLGGVDGHDLHAVPGVFRIAVPQQGDVPEKIGQRQGFAEVRLPGDDAPQQLRDIVQPLDVPAFPDVQLIPGIVENPLQQFRNGGVRPSFPKGFHGLHELFCPGAFEHLRIAQGLQTVVQGQPVIRRIHGEGLQLDFADFPPGHVDDPLEGQIVRRVVRKAHVGQHILDLRPFVKSHAAVNGVGDVLFQKALFHEAGDKPRPVQNGKIAVLSPGGHMVPDLPGNPGDFFRIVFGVQICDLFPAGSVGHKGLFHPVRISGDQGIGGIQNGRQGAVVFRQNHVGGGEPVLVLETGIVQPALKVHDYIHVGAPPFVDVLVGIPHHKQIPVGFGEPADQLEFLGGDVLELVHHNVAQPCLPLFQHLRKGSEQVDGEVDQIEEVQPEILPLFFDVPENDLVRGLVGGQCVVVEIRVGQVGDIGDQILVVPDLVDHEPEGRRVHFDAHLVIDLFQNFLLIHVIQYDEILRIEQFGNLLPQHPGAEGMEGSYKRRVKGIPQHGLDPLFHFVCGLIGEGDAEDVGGRDSVFVYQICIPVGQGSGFPGTGPGDDPDIPFRSGDGLHLGWIQIGKNIRHGFLRL